MVTNTRIRVQTSGNCDFIDMTDKVQQKVTESGIKDGIVTVFVAGSTAGVTTIEFERGVLDQHRLPHRVERQPGLDPGHLDHVEALRLGDVEVHGHPAAAARREAGLRRCAGDRHPRPFD